MAISYPKLGEVFELTLDGDAPENQPMAMVARAGLYPRASWEYKGIKVVGRQTRKFQLVHLVENRHSEYWSKLISELWDHGLKYGGIPEGQWLMAFKTAYPEPDGEGPVGVPDILWKTGDLSNFFPYVGTNGLGFASPADAGSGWRWLVRAAKYNI